jgi:hypothetical protein
MIERNRRAILLGALSLLAVPAFAGVAMAGKHDGHDTEGGGGSTRGAHDDHFTCPPKSDPLDNHDNNQQS